jgi:hypothetical protein
MGASAERGQHHVLVSFRDLGPMPKLETLGYGATTTEDGELTCV